MSSCVTRAQIAIEVGTLEVWGVLFSLWVERQLSEGRTVVVHWAGPVCWDVWEQHCCLKGSDLGLGVSVLQLGLALVSPRGMHFISPCSVLVAQ